MNYEEAKADIDRYKALGSVYGLDGITRLMEALGRPERALKVIHVAGTNGKGSTVTTLATILDACGIHTATYTSPEVTTYLDRFRVGGLAASEADFASAYTRVAAASEKIVGAGFPHPTIFEMELAIAYLIAIANGAEVMVQETGLGGRLDATNVVEQPVLVVFTAIGMDHMQFLGDTIEEIAAEKAGIIKSGVPVVAYDNGLAINAIIKEAAVAMDAPCTFATMEMCSVVERGLDGQEVVFEAHRYHYPLIGSHQTRNLALILKAVSVLRECHFVLPVDKVQSALRQVRWPGRFEVVCKDPLIVLDGAHNPQAASALTETVQQWFPDKRVHFILHIFKDKDALGILTALAPVASAMTLTTIDDARSSDPAELAKLAKLVVPGAEIRLEPDYELAVLDTLKILPAGDLLIICGSLSHLEASRRILSHLERIQFNG